jgi:hypothetical protein
VPPNPLSEYLDRVERALSEYESVYVERYEEEILTPRRTNLKIRLRFNGTHLLEINEAIVSNDNKLEFLDYRYHFFKTDRIAWFFATIARRIFPISLLSLIINIYRRT